MNCIYPYGYIRLGDFTQDKALRHLSSPQQLQFISGLIGSNQLNRNSNSNIRIRINQLSVS